MTEEHPITRWAAGLRELADFAEAHPETFAPYMGLTCNLFPRTRENFSRQARDLGKANKVDMSSYYGLQREFGPHSVQLLINREQVCERVQTGTRTVTVPDPDVDVPTVEIEEPVYEWQCPDSILAGKP